MLQSGRTIARRYHVDYSIRFMAGRHTPTRVFDKGCPFYTKRSLQGDLEKVPAPFTEDGVSNAIFEREYEALVARLSQWCRTQEIHLLHLAWYGQDWAELNHGREVRALPGYTFENWLRAHQRLVDIGLKYAGEGLAIELPFSGYGPCCEAAGAGGPRDCEDRAVAAPVLLPSQRLGAAGRLGRAPIRKLSPVSTRFGNGPSVAASR